MGKYNHDTDSIEEALGLSREEVVRNYQKLLRTNPEVLSSVSRRVELVEDATTPKEMSIIISVLTDELDDRIRIEHAMPDWLVNAIDSFRQHFIAQECMCDDCKIKLEEQESKAFEAMENVPDGELPPGLLNIKNKIQEVLRAAGLPPEDIKVVHASNIDNKKKSTLSGGEGGDA